MKPILRPLRIALCLFAFALFTSCATQQRPVSAEDYLQSARAQLGAVYQTIGDLKAQGSITQTQSRTAIVKAEGAESQLDQARTLIGAGNAGGAQQLAAVAVAVLLDIQANLPKPKGP